MSQTQTQIPISAADIPLAVTPEQFRGTLTAFSGAPYTDPDILFWLTVASNFLNAGRWGRLLNLGICFFAAHNLILEQHNRNVTLSGGLPAITTGMISSKGIGRVSVSYDTGSVAIQEENHWNLTTYGIRFISMARMFGAGPVQVGPGGVCFGGFWWNANFAWPGPPPWPGWFSS